MFTVTINTDALSEERRSELEEAIEQALTIMTEGSYQEAAQSRPDWAALAAALLNARGI